MQTHIRILENGKLKKHTFSNIYNLNMELNLPELITDKKMNNDWICNICLDNKYVLLCVMIVVVICFFCFFLKERATPGSNPLFSAGAADVDKGKGKSRRKNQKV